MTPPSRGPTGRRIVPGFLAVLLAVLTACSATTGTASTTPSGAAPSLASIAATPSTEASTMPSESPASTAPTDSPEPTAVPTSISACDLVTQAEAAALIGGGAAPGTEDTEQNVKVCSYSQEGVVFEVLVSVTPDAAAAKAAEPAFVAQIKQGASDAGLKDLKVTELPEFEPGVDAATITGSATVSGVTLKGVSIYALKGAVIVGLSFVSIGAGEVPTTDEMEAQARTSLGRLP